MLEASAVTEIRALAAAGTSRSEIARRVGCDRKTVREHLRVVAAPLAPVAGRPPRSTAPTPPAPRSSPATGPSDAGRVAAEAFILLDSGAGPAVLVKSMHLTPAQATGLFDAWRAAQVAGERADAIRAFVALRRRMQTDGLDYDDLGRTLDRIEAAEGLLEKGGYASDEAIELLAEMRSRFGGFKAATHALRALPRAERSRVEAEAAEERARRAEARVVAAEQKHTSLMRQIQALVEHRAYLRLAHSLDAAASHTGDGGVDCIRDALADVRVGAAAPAAGALAGADGEAEAAARMALAKWAADELGDLLVSRTEHEDALEAGRRRVLADMLLVAAVARSAVW